MMPNRGETECSLLSARFLNYLGSKWITPIASQSRHRFSFHQNRNLRFSKLSVDSVQSPALKDKFWVWLGSCCFEHVLTRDSVSISQPWGAAGGFGDAGGCRTQSSARSSPSPGQRWHQIPHWQVSLCCYSTMKILKHIRSKYLSKKSSCLIRKTQHFCAILVIFFHLLFA